MKLLQKLCLVMLHLFSMQVIVSSEEDLEVYRYRLPDVIAQTKNLATSIGQGRHYNSIVFNSSVTVNGTNAFTLGATDALTVHTESSGDVEIDAAGGITGITPRGTIDGTGTPASLFPNLTLKDSDAGNVTITGNVHINGNLTLGGDATTNSVIIDGDLIVKGQVSIDANASLEVRGDVIFDGDGASAISIAGTLAVQGLQNTFASGSATQRGHLLIRNATSVTIAATTTTTGDVIVENNTGAISINNSITSQGVVSFINNTRTGGNTITVNTATITAKKDIVFFKNNSTLPNSAVRIESGGQLTSSQHVYVVENTNGGLVCLGNITAKNGTICLNTYSVSIVTSGTIQGDVVVVGTSGSVSINNKTIQGNILIDGSSGVSFPNVIGVTADNIVIKRCTASTGSNPLQISNVIVKHDLVLHDNVRTSTNSCIQISNTNVIGGNLDIQNNTTDTNNTVVFANGSITTVDKNILIANNTTSAASQDAILAASATVIAKENITFLKNESTNGTPGNGVNISGGAITASKDLAFIDNVGVSGVAISGELTSDIGNIAYKNNGGLTLNVGAGITGDIVTYEDFTVTTALQVHGNLTVLGGNVTTSAALTVDNAIIFDGQTDGSTNNKVTIGSTINAHDITIRNYRSTDDHAVDIAGAITATGDVVFDNNEGATGSGTAGFHGVNITASITASQSAIICKNNTGGTGSTSSDNGQLGGYGVRIAANLNTLKFLGFSNTGGQGGIGANAGTGGQGAAGVSIQSNITAKDCILMLNTGGLGGNHFQFNGALGDGGSGIHITTTGSCTIYKNLEIINNTGGAGHNGVNSQLSGDGGVGCLIETGNAVTANHTVLISNNTGGAAGTGGAANGIAGHACYINANGSIVAHEIHFVRNISPGTGSTHGVFITTPNASNDLDITAYDGLHFSFNEGGDLGNGVLIQGTDADDEVNIIASDLYIKIDCSSDNGQKFDFGANTTLTGPYGVATVEHVHNPNGCPTPSIP